MHVDVIFVRIGYENDDIHEILERDVKEWCEEDPRWTKISHKIYDTLIHDTSYMIHDT